MSGIYLILFKKIISRPCVFAVVRRFFRYCGRYLVPCNVVDAMRNRKQLEDSRDSLRYAVLRLQKEIDLIEADIASLGVDVRLDDRFFWEVLAPNIAGVTDGYTTTQMIRILENKGQNVTPGNFRTFISRYGQRGYLEASGTGRALQWKLTTASVERLRSQKRTT